MITPGERPMKECISEKSQDQEQPRLSHNNKRKRGKSVMNNSSSVAPSANSSSGVASSRIGSTNSTPDHSTSATTGAGELSSQHGEGVGTKSRNSHCIVYPVSFIFARC